MASYASNQAVKRNGSTWSLPSLMGGYPSKPEPQFMPTTPDARESYWAFEKSHFRTFDEHIEAAAAAPNGRDGRQPKEISASARFKTASSTSTTSLSTLVDGPSTPFPAQGTKMVASASSAASAFKHHVLRHRPKKAERPPDKAEVSINAAIYGATRHNESSTLIFPLQDGRDSESASTPDPAPPSPPRHRRSLSMFTTRTRKTSTVSFSIGDKIEAPAKPMPSSSSTSLFTPGYSLLSASQSTIELGTRVCESPMSSTLEVDKVGKANHAVPDKRRVRTTSFKEARRGSCPPVAFPAGMADDASETASIRTVPAPRSILKRSSDTASLRSFATGDAAPTFDEARRKLEVYAEAAEDEEDAHSDVVIAVSGPSIRKSSPPTSVRTTMSTASRISQMPKRAQTWVVDASKGVTKGATSVGSALLDTAYPSRVQKRITLDEGSRPTRSQSQWAIADHILREKTKLPESKRDPAADFHLWNAERLNLNWKMKNGERKKTKSEEEEAQEDELRRPPSMISFDDEPLYMSDSSAWLAHCDRAWSFIPEGVDLHDRHQPTVVNKRSATAPNPPTQERITFIRRAQSEPQTSNAARDTADQKTLGTMASEDSRFFKDNSREVSESPKSSLLLTPVSSNEPNAPQRADWPQESLASTATCSTQSFKDKDADWEANPRLCDSDDLDDELYNAVLNMNLSK